MLRPGLALVSSPFPTPVLQGAQVWLLAETPHQPPISRDRVCSPTAQERSSPASEAPGLGDESGPQTRSGHHGQGPKAA